MALEDILFEILKKIFLYFNLKGKIFYRMKSV